MAAFLPKFRGGTATFFVEKMRTKCLEKWGISGIKLVQVGESKSVSNTPLTNMREFAIMRQYVPEEGYFFVRFWRAPTVFHLSRGKTSENTFITEEMEDTKDAYF